MSSTDHGKRDRALSNDASCGGELCDGAEATVFVVDDEPSARTSLQALVSSLGYPCVVFDSAEAFLQSVEGDPCGCLITDLRMDGISGEALQEELNRRGMMLPVIAISGYADTSTAVRVMRRGAMTLLEKPCRNEELIEAIEQALARDARERERQMRRRDFVRRLNELTDVELEVFNSLLLGRPNKRIAKELDIGLRTVEAHRQRVFEKMGVASVVELAKLAALAGHRLPTGS